MNFIRQAFRVFVSVSLAISVFVSIFLTLLYFTPGVVEPGFSRFECPSMYEMSKVDREDAKEYIGAMNSYNKLFGDWEFYEDEESYDESLNLFDPVVAAENYKKIVEGVPETLKKIESDPDFKNEDNYRAYVCRYDSDSTVSYLEPKIIFIAWGISAIFILFWLLSRILMKRKDREINIRARYVMETAVFLVFALIVYGSFASLMSSTDYSDTKSCSVADLNSNYKEVSQADEFKVSVIANIGLEVSFDGIWTDDKEISREDLDRAVEIRKSVEDKAKRIVAEIKRDPGYKNAVAVDEKGGLDCQSYARQSVLAVLSALVVFGFRWAFIHIAYRRRKKSLTKQDVPSGNASTS